MSDRVKSNVAMVLAALTVVVTAMWVWIFFTTDGNDRLRIASVFCSIIFAINAGYWFMFARTKGFAAKGQHKRNEAE